MDKKIDLIIVDDNRQYLEAVVMYLSTKKHYSVLGTAVNGLDLLNHPSLHYADVVLMDCEMPVMDGIEAARQVNFTYPYKKLIAITMFNDQINLVELLGAGFNGYIYKPEFASKIDNVIERVLNDEYVFEGKLGVKDKES